MPPYEGLTGFISFDSHGKRINFTIDIHRVALNMPLSKVSFDVYKLVCLFNSLGKIYILINRLVRTLVIMD
jgi:hypothetical protein